MSATSYIAAASYMQQGGRPYQEDALYPAEICQEDRLFVVCDGVGGLEGGARASQAVCRFLPEELSAECRVGRDISDARLMQAVHRVMERMARENLGDAATTMAMLFLHADGALVVHIGDSRVYQFRKGAGRVFRTRDHSWVQELVDNGIITEEQARNHPRSNIITQSMHALKQGEELPTLAIDRIDDVRVGDVFLLCTDGVWGMLTDDFLGAHLTNEKQLAARMQAMAEATVKSNDNNTAIAVEIQEMKGTPHRYLRLLKKLLKK